MVVVPIVVPFAFPSASFPLLFQLAPAIPRLTAMLAVAANCLIEPLFGLMDLSLALIVPIESLHRKGATQKQTSSEQCR
jgi:hypothetical protein